MEPGVAVLGVVIVVLVHTGALFYWGGRVTRSIEAHDKELARHSEEITAVRTRYHDQVIPLMMETRTTLELSRSQLARFEDQEERGRA